MEMEIFMFKLISDSAFDINKDFAEKNGITMVPLYVTFDGENYHKEQIDVDPDEFYRRLVEDGAFPKSSLPTIQDYTDAFLPYVKQNMPIICICISTTLSGSYNSASTARLQLLDDYPDAKITVIDSRQDAASQGLFVYEALRMRNDNVPYEKAVSVLNEMIPYGRIFFTIGSLDYLQKGGRIGKLASLISGKLSIRPLIILKNGELGIGGIARTRNKSKANVISLCKKFLKDADFKKENYVFSVEAGYGLEECEEFRKEVEEQLDIKCLESTEEYPTRIGVVTACHTGPYPIGIGVMPKYENFI